MKHVTVGVLALVVAAASTAHADAPTDTAQGEAIQQRFNAALTAIKKKQAGKATTFFADVVTIEGLPFRTGTCSKPFGGNKRTEVAGAARAGLITCFGKEKWFSAKLPFRVEKRGDAWTVWMQLEPGYLLTEIPLLMKDDGTFVIRGIHAPVVDGIEGGDPGDIPAPIAGGVVYVDPRPPVTHVGPQNVAPAVLERFRLSGDKQIVPDDETKEAIQKSGREKIIGSFKMCLDAAGKVASVRTLKATGYPAYDAKITTGIQAWTYKPYLVDGKPAPVCTAVTFIYSQK